MKWEYKILEIEVPYTALGEIDRDDVRTEEELNKLGDDGWEAVSAWSEAQLGSFVLLRRSK